MVDIIKIFKLVENAKKIEMVEMGLNKLSLGYLFIHLYLSSC